MSTSEYSLLTDETHVDINPSLHVNSQAELEYTEKRKKREDFVKNVEGEHGILREDNVGLAFSGGGIRSAAFSSGV